MVGDAATLPSFDASPLNEVVVGVQFSAPPGYSAIYAREVWELYRENYPNLTQLAPIAPTFETFGASALAQPPSVQLVFNQGNFAHPRYWFLSSDGHDLIQFQSDRLLHNWRQVEGSGEYPRFEPTIGLFGTELRRLSEFMARFDQGKGLAISQTELSYINFIREPDGTTPRPDKYLRFLHTGDRVIEGYSGTFRQVFIVKENLGARLYVETANGSDALGRQGIVLNLTLRGAPADNSIGSAIEYLAACHDVIVPTFADLTTDEAHRLWRIRK